jgi:hypothetical protein
VNVSDYKINYKCNNNLFVIYYDRKTQKYYLRQIYDKKRQLQCLIFIKIEDKQIVNIKKFFLIGHLLISIEPTFNQ